MRDDAEFERAVERLYAAFAHHPLPADMAACEHCVDPAEVALFARTPLRKLAPDQLGTYLIHPGTWGDGTEFPHLLPRLLEAYATGEMEEGGHWPDSVTRRISGQWQTWPAPERDAVEHFVRVWWHRALDGYPSVTPVGDLLDAIAELGVDVGPYLAEFAAVPGEAPARHLADVVSHWMRGSYLHDGAEESMRRWLAGPTPVDVLLSAAVASASPEIAAELADAAEYACLIGEGLLGEGVPPDAVPER
ncbi:hypothetical protein [Micromonospora rubida]|uniref:hypothetical protein n=1 Tax=Micromonospora rubida TaxID=2697657 RepID=UPI001378BC5E|nr:hypothetical protein [Micromonospora rubida]NBE81230.1 hypothetical protein [Micromonospora rubida]